ncbi:DUF4355 domain-containing protein [Alkalihalophilus marmarensis]|uniref:capsid assembly scaffolding protein Gp46 family protein n=1 Tax=Alkalihalophilus marmarensis TaxID=521377 RepID=UPI00203E15CF|nr:DUF4355 domain-containing protein [Alkalihalophilus marmarensis]MCM3488787.1 DUF4355 domain-containing protein [Alkalihalophilus marmarensis]
MTYAQRKLPFFKHKSFLPLKLQYFSSEEGQEDNQEDGPEDPETISMTKEELEAEKQREADRRVSEALKKREDNLRKEMQKEMEERIAKERKDAEELANLSAEERTKAEKEREEMRLQKEREKLESEKQAFYRERLEIQTARDLQKRDLPDISKYVTKNDAESTLDAIVEVERILSDWHQAKMSKALATGIPKTGSGNQKGHNPWMPETRNLTEQGKIMKENPEYAKKLAAQAGVKL